jgi:hypothetical protein
MKFVSNWPDSYYADTEKQYTISELIELLEFMKVKFGDCTVLVEDAVENKAYGFSNIRFVSNEWLRKLYPEDGFNDEIRILI